MISDHLPFLRPEPSRSSSVTGHQNILVLYKTHVSHLARFPFHVFLLITLSCVKAQLNEHCKPMTCHLTVSQIIPGLVSTNGIWTTRLICLVTDSVYFSCGIKCSMFWHNVNYEINITKLNCTPTLSHPPWSHVESPDFLHEKLEKTFNCSKSCKMAHIPVSHFICLLLEKKSELTMQY